MAFSGGTFSRTFDCTTDRDNGVKILASKFDTELDGMATGLSTCILKDGTQTCTAAIPFAEGLTVPDNKTIILGTNSDITIQYDESTNDSLEIAANVEGAALGIVLKADQGDDNADQHKVNIADGGTLTMASKISGSFVSYITHTPNSTVASSTTAVAGNLTVGGDLTLGSGAVISEAELEKLDGITNGTVAADKAVVVDSNKDIASFRNVTLTGELDAGSLDVSGDADIDGTLEADAITVNGTALNTVIAGVTVTDATNSAHVLVTDNESTNEENLITFVEDATSSTGNVGLEMDGNLTYNPSTGTVTATVFKGNIDAVDGDFDGTLEADAMTLNGTAITATATLDTGISNNNVPKFTSGVADNDFLRVDGTAIEGRSASEVLSDIGAAPAAGDSNIVTTGALNSGSITSGFGAIDNGSSNITTTGVGTFASLDISGDIDVDGTTNLDDVDIDGTASIAGHASIGVDAVNSARALTVAGATDGSSSSILVCYNSSLASKLSVRDDGFVDIAGNMQITTADNTDQLILKSTDADASVGPVLRMNRDSGSPADNDLLGSIIFQADDDGGNSINFVEIITQMEDASAGSRSADLFLKTRTNGSLVSRIGMYDSTTAINDDGADIDFRVESNGSANMLFVDAGNDRVGIGTGSPVNILDVIGNGSGAAVKGRIRNEGGAAGDDATLELSIATASEEMRILFTDSSGTAGQIVVDGGDNSMAFETGTAERARIDSSGRLLVGTTSPFENAGITAGANDTSSSVAHFNRAASGSAAGVVRYYGSGSEVGSVQVTTSATTYTSASDIRLKQDIEPLEATDKLMAMNPVSYAWKADPDGPRSMGFIANEMIEVMPEAVSTGDDDDAMMSMDYGRITPILVSALQDAHRKIKELENRIAALEG